MVLPQSREGYNCFSIVRPVEGADKFLNKVRHYSEIILGPQFSNVVIEPVEDDRTHDDSPEEGTELDLIGIGPPRLKVYDSSDLAVTLLQRRIPPELNFGSRFNIAAGKLRSQLDLGSRTRDINDSNTMRSVSLGPDVAQASVKRKKPVRNELYRQLQADGLRHGIADQDAVTLRCPSVDVRQEPDLPFKELVLLPDPLDNVTLMLLDQARTCFQALYSLAPKAAFTVNFPGIALPFARLPLDTADDEYARLVETINTKILVRPVRLIMRGFSTRQNTAHRGAGISSANWR